MIKNIIISLLIVLVAILGYNSYKAPTIVCTHLQKVDSLQLIVDSLQQKKSEIVYITDSIIIETTKVKDKYETLYIDVSNQSVDSDIKFFSDYISSYD
jgi:hypothetical protein